jgi:hypothetical protein
MIDRIAKLLALAEAASTPAEAEAAFAKAQTLASKFSIDLEMARRTQAPTVRQKPIMRVIRIGEKGKHANAGLIKLFSRVADANDVDVLIARDSTFVEAYGLPSDIDTTEAVWMSLATAMTRHGDALVRDKNAEWRTERVQVWDDRLWRTVEKPMTGQSARKSFYNGFTSRIAARLMEAREASIKQADSDHFHNDAPVGAVGSVDGAALPSSMALVLKEKKAEVTDFMWKDYERRYGKRRAGAWRGGQSSTAHSRSAAAAGRATADRTDLGSRSAIAS